MNRRKFLSSAVALAVAPALPSIAAPVVPAGLPLLLAHDPCARLPIPFNFFQLHANAISVEYVNGRFSGTISRVNKGGK